VAGVIALFSQLSAVYALTFVFGAYDLIDVVASVVMVVRHAHEKAEQWWSMILRSVLGKRDTSLYDQVIALISKERTHARVVPCGILEPLKTSLCSFLEFPTLFFLPEGRGVYQQVTCCFSQLFPADFLPIGFLEVPTSRFYSVRCSRTKTHTLTLIFAYLFLRFKLSFNIGLNSRT
jgi:hypothetical protein